MMEKIFEYIINGRIGRFSYLLSLLIVVVGLYYVDTFYFSDRCLVCQPIRNFPWIELCGCFVFIVLLGPYFLLLYLWTAFQWGISMGTLMYILLVIFFFVQTIKRCRDMEISNWRALIPVYSPLFLLFLRDKGDDVQEPIKLSFLMTLWNSKWLILALILFCVYIYLKNAMFIHIHNSI